MSSGVCQFVFKRSAQLLPAKRLLSTTPKLSTRALSADDLFQETQCPITKAVSVLEDTFGFNKNNETSLNEQLSDGIKPFSKVPGPKGLPLIGTLFDYFKKDGFRFNKMFEAYQQRAMDYGPIFKENIAAISTVVISDPHEYAKVIQSEGRYPIRKEMEPLAFYRTQKGLGLGLVSAQGEEWHKYRTVLSKKMLKPKEVADYCVSMNEVADDFMDRLKSVQDEDFEVPNLEKELFKWAMESIGTVLFEERIGCFQSPTPPLAQGFIDNLMGFFKCLQPLMYNVPLYKIYPTKLWKEYENYADNVMSFGKQLVDKKVDAIKAQVENGLDPFEKEEKSAFLTYLLSQTSLTPEEANSSAVDMLTGAVETTSNGTVWVLYCLAQNPEIQEKIFEEVSRCLPEGGEITPKTLTNIPYIKASLKETFRIYPITFATSRYLQEDTEIAGYNIPSGTHVQGNTFAMGRDPSLFPEPEKFIPERWMRGNNDNNLRAFSNLVWGHGARMCIGRRFAEQEIYIALAKIVQNFKLEYRHEPLQPVLNTIMTPDRPARIAFIPRTKTGSQ